MFLRQGERYSIKKVERRGVCRFLDRRALNRIWIAVVAQAVDLHLRWGNGGGPHVASQPHQMYVRAILKSMLKLWAYLSMSNYILSDSHYTFPAKFLLDWD